MFDDFKDDQGIIYKIIINSLRKNKCSHAYLIETNNYIKSLEFVKALAKAFLCPFGYTNGDNCNLCNQCKLIDDDNFIELKIIKPDGEWIKKEQLVELQNLFSKKAVIGNKKVYIIDGVEKLNTNSANSILKFLEEPLDGIYAFLVTDNINKVLNTIVSRCQILSLKNSFSKCSNKLEEKVASKIFNSENKISDFVNNESTNNYIINCINFVDYYEKNHMDTLIYIDSLWNNYFIDRKDIYIGFEIILLYYNDILNYLLNCPIEVFDDYKKNIQDIALNSNITNISKKISFIMDLQEKIKYNVNTNLLMDKLIIGLEGCDVFE